MAINTNDILRGAVRFTDPWGNDYVNTMHFRVVARGTGTDAVFLLDVATYWLTNYNSIQAMYSNGYVSKDCRFERVEWSGGKEVVLETFAIVDCTGLQGGTNGNDPLPPNVGPVVTFRTSGVRTLPKQYLMPPCEDKYGVGGFGSGTISSLATFIGWFLADVVGIGYSGATIRAVVHSKRALDWVVFVAGTIEKYCSHQNRRKTGVGS
jgi:hypothetical protein